MTGPGLQMYLIFYSPSTVIEDSFQVWEVGLKLVGIVCREIIVHFVSISPFDHRLPADTLKDLLGSYFLVAVTYQQKGEALEFLVYRWVLFVVLSE